MSGTASDTPTDTGFGPDHLPYAVFAPAAGGPARVGTRLGDRVVDLGGLRPELATGSLDALMALGPAGWREVREQVTALVATDPATVPLADVRLRLPFTVRDYVDFYASEHHATNVGRIFRPDEEPLPPHWRHLPIGYHGRSGSVVVSGTDVVRPHGQRLLPGDTAPTHGPTTRLDLEAEVACVVGAPSEPGEPVGHDRLADHVFGVVLLDDWSARDLQAWEYRPLGPFLAKSFATSIAAWVTPLAALDAAWCDLPGQDPEPLPYLGPGATRGLDLALEVEVDGTVLTRPPHASTYWSPAQMLAHLTANGAAVRTGDLYASGTVSGPGDDEVGSLLELTRGGTVPRAGGRTWLEDGEVVTVRGSAPATGGGRLTLGEVSGRVLPARDAARR